MKDIAISTSFEFMRIMLIVTFYFVGDECYELRAGTERGSARDAALGKAENSL